MYTVLQSMMRRHRLRGRDLCAGRSLGSGPGPIVVTAQPFSDGQGQLPLKGWRSLSLPVDLLAQEVQSAW